MTDLFEAASLADIAEARTGVLSTLAASAALPPVQRSAVQAHAYTAMARLGLLPNSPATRAAIEDCQDKIKCMFEAGAVDLGVAAGQVEALRILLEIALARNDDRGGPIEATINAILDDLLSVQGVSDMDSQLLYNVVAADFEWADRAENGLIAQN
jgi:hypothetical protein